MKISLLCPTRKRPKNMIEMFESFHSLANDNSPESFDVIFYIDDDDQESLQCVEEMKKARGDQVKFITGPRIVLSQMWNECQQISDADLFWHMGDDVRMRTGNWDFMVKHVFKEFPDKILFLYGPDGIQNEKLGTHGIVSKEWVNAVGYFVPPKFSSGYNDTWLNEVSDRIGRRIYMKGLVIEHLHYSVGKHPHDITHVERQQRAREDDVHNLWAYTQDERIADANKLKKYIEEFNNNGNVE